MSKKIRVERRRVGDFFVNYPRGTGVYDKYLWNGAKKGYVDSKEIPEEVVNWLAYQTSTFKKGHLVIAKDEKSKEAKAVIDNIRAENENIDKETHTYEEIEELLSGHLTNAKKDKLKSIESQEEKEFVLEVAKGMKLDSVVKREFIAELLDTDVNTIF